MNDHGFTEVRQYARARDIIAKKGSPELVSVDCEIRVDEAIRILNREGISQLPVVQGSKFVGSVTDTKLLHAIIEDPEIKNIPVREVMGKPLQFVGMDNTLDVLSSLIDNDKKALLVTDEKNRTHIITQHDILMAMTQ
jgi:cystathionine beta-synthase